MNRLRQLAASARGVWQRFDADAAMWNYRVHGIDRRQAPRPVPSPDEHLALSGEELKARLREVQQ